MVMSGSALRDPSSYQAGALPMASLCAHGVGMVDGAVLEPLAEQARQAARDEPLLLAPPFVIDGTSACAVTLVAVF